ncbi:MAG: AroM family protein [Bacillota bacterium]
MQPIGIATIGQSPRDDVVPGMRAVWGKDLPVLQRGGLDDLTASQLQALEPETDAILVSRLRDGSEIRMDSAAGEEMLWGAVKHLAEAGADPIVILCTGARPVPVATGRVIWPRELFPRMIRGLSAGPVGVMVPDRRQEIAAGDLFREYCSEVFTASASPYGFAEDRDAFGDVAAFFARHHVEVIAMNCMGYDAEMAAYIKENSEVPAIPASIVVAHATALLVDSSQRRGREE